VKFQYKLATAIPIPITTIGMRLPHVRINVKRVAASKPKALGMVANAVRLTTIKDYLEKKDV